MGKKTSKWYVKFGASALSAAMILSGSFSNIYAKTTASDVAYFKDSNGNNTAIKGFNIGDYSYYSVADYTGKKSDGSIGAVTNMNSGVVKNIIANDILPKWGIVAEGVFRDQANQLVTIEGSGLMSSSTDAKNSFDRQFSANRDGVSGYKYDWVIQDLAKTLGGAEKNTGIDTDGKDYRGGLLNDYSRSTGLFEVGSLSEARTAMGQQLRNAADDNDLTVDDFLGNKKDKSSGEYRLPDLVDDKSGKGFCNIVTCVNQAGISDDYDYVSFGLCIYDIGLTPVAAENLEYVDVLSGNKSPLEEIKGVEGFDYSYKEDSKVGNTAINKSTEEVTQQVTLERSTSSEVSNSVEKSEEYSFEESVGADFNVGKAMESVARATIHINFTAGQTFGTTESKSKSESQSTSNSINTSVTLPPHTAVDVNQDNAAEDFGLRYQCPVVLSYKVAIFAMSGDFYNSGFGGLISNSRYDKQWLSVRFENGGIGTNSGSTAITDLYDRVFVNANTAGHDFSTGRYRSWCDKKSWTQSKNINWTEVRKQLNDYMSKRDSHKVKIGLDANNKAIYGSDPLADVVNYLPMVEVDSHLTTIGKKTSSSVGTITPYYNLNSIGFAKKASDELNLNMGETAYLDSIDLEGYNRYNVPFYGFDQSLGEWVLCDEGGEPLSPEVIESSVVSLRETADGSQKIEAKNIGGTAYLTWRFSDANKVIGSYEGEVRASEINDFPILTVSVDDSYGMDNATIEINGKYEGIVGAKSNLNKEINVAIKDNEGFEVDRPVIWKAVEKNGVDVNEDGNISLNKEGTFHAKAGCYVKDSEGKSVVIWSNPVEILSKGESRLTSMSLEDVDNPGAFFSLSRKNRTLSFDISNYINYTDQYGNNWQPVSDGWQNLMPEISYELSTTNAGGAILTDYGRLTITEPGMYYVKVGTEQFGYLKNPKTDQNYLLFYVLENKELDRINMSDPSVRKSDMTLTKNKDEVEIYDLTRFLEYYDQSGNKWSGDKPKVTLSLAHNYQNAEIADNNFYASEPGIYTIQPKCNGFEINPIDIQVFSEDYVKDVEMNQPPMFNLTEENPKVSIDLRDYVTLYNQYGKEYKCGDNTDELVFALEKSNGAEVIGNRFEVDKSGYYVISISSSAYNGVIDYLVIKVADAENPDPVDPQWDIREDYSNCKVEVSGKYKGYYKDTKNLNDILTANVVDENGFHIKKDVVWKAVELKGIDVKEDGSIKFDAVGTYHVKAGIKSNSSINAGVKWSDNTCEINVVVNPKFVAKDAQMELGKNLSLSAIASSLNTTADQLTWTVQANKSVGTVVNANGTLHLADDETSKEVVVIATSKENPENYIAAIIRPVAGHIYKTSYVKATLTKSGYKYVKCSVCGQVKENVKYLYPKTLKLNKNIFVYNGNFQRPTFIVKDAAGNVIPASNYTVTYSNSRSYKVGTYAARIIFKGNYTGSKNFAYKILPKGTSLKTLTPGKKEFTATWAKQAAETNGYLVQYSTTNTFKNPVTKAVKNTTTKLRIQKLNSKKKYFVRIRTYRIVNKVKYFSTWSTVKAVTTK